jgi:hypothetical protein
VKIRPLQAAACAVAAALSVVTVTSPALAGGKQTRQVQKPATAKAAAFSLNGIVVSKQGNQIKVLTKTGKIGRTKVGNTLQTLTATSRTRTHGTKPVARAQRVSAQSGVAAIVPGLHISATGTVSGTTLTVVDTTVTPVPDAAVYGRIQSVAGGLVTLLARDEARGDGDRHGHGDHGRGERTVVHVESATISGAATSAAGLKAGQYVVALGENDDHTMLAANVAVFDAAPQVLLGKVTAVDATARTLTVESHDSRRDDDDEDWSGTKAPVMVDASQAQVVLNGQAVAGTAFPAVGDYVLVVAPGTTPVSTSPSPTATPTSSPTVDPTATPTSSPTVDPTATPTSSPTASPVVGSVQATLVFAFNRGEHGQHGQHGQSGGHGHDGNDD